MTGSRCEVSCPVPGVILRCDKPTTTRGPRHREHHATYELAHRVIHIWWREEPR